MKRIGSHLLTALLMFAIAAAIAEAGVIINVPAGGSIQTAINAAASGDTIQLAAGTYAQNVILNKYVILQGVGSGSDPSSNSIIAPAAGSCITIVASGADQANPLIVRNLRATGASYGVNFLAATALTVSHVLLDNIFCTGGNQDGLQIESTGVYTTTVTDLTIKDSSFNNYALMGFRVSKRGIVDGLTVIGCHFDNNADRGWYAQNVYPDWSTTITNVQMSYTTFNYNLKRGWFLEKLENADFDHITMIDNGTAADANASGLELNLKYADYENIAIRNSLFVHDASGNSKNRGPGIFIKARNDGSYSTFPATLDNVLIENTEVTGCHVGIAFGEYDQNPINNPSNVVVRNCCIHGNTVSGLLVNGQTIIEATKNWWGSSTGPAGTGPGTGDAVGPNVNYDPWLTGATYTGALKFPSLGPFFLTAQVATSAGAAPGINCRFFIDGTFAWEATTDANGNATLDAGSLSPDPHTVEIVVAGGCVSSGVVDIQVVDHFTINASAGPHGSISPSGAVIVHELATQSFTITPDPGYHIADVVVNGASVGATPDYHFIDVTADHNISATFAINRYALTVNAVNGTVTVAPNQPLYDHGTPVTLTATPAAGYHFVNWTGTVTSTANPLTITMDGPKTITANFAYYPFSSFVVDEAKIDWKKKADDDKIRVKGSFVYPPTSDGVKPGELVTLVVGKFSQSIVMEEKGKGGNWEFKRAKGGTGIKDAKIDFKKNEITFEFHIDKADLDELAPWTNGMTISLRIGDDMGSGFFTFDEKKDKWEYHK